MQCRKDLVVSKLGRGGTGSMNALNANLATLLAMWERNVPQIEGSYLEDEKIQSSEKQ